MFKAAITGTNGKTSVAFIASQFMNLSGFKAASLGTFGLLCGENSDSDPILVGSNAVSELAEELEQTLDVDGFFFEAFSASIEARLYDNVNIDVAVLTNIEADHLDFHGSKEGYVSAKLRLFEEVLGSGKSAVFNHDDEISEKIIEICKRRSIKYLSYGKSEDADVKVRSINIVGDKTDVEIKFKNKLFTATLSFIGEMFVQNWLCAISISLLQGQEIEQLVDHSPSIALPPGRMEKIGDKNIYIDYAHNAAALKAVLKVLKSNSAGDLHLVFGCGGERDKSKRRTMGQIANDYADVVYITDDNPRTENAEKIKSTIFKNCPKGLMISDRKAAIDLAIKRLEPGDVLLVAGKGHETYQEVNGSKLAHCDKTTVSKFLKNSIAVHT